MNWWPLCWLLLSLVPHYLTCKGPGGGQNNRPGVVQDNEPCPCPSDPFPRCGKNHSNVGARMRRRPSETKCCMGVANNLLKSGDRSETIEAMKNLEEILEETEVTETESMFEGHFVAALHRPRGPFKGLEFHASDKEAKSDKPVNNSKVSVRLPRELNAGTNNTIVFCMLTWPEANGTIWGNSEVLYESRLIGLSVRGKKVSGLRECVNITVQLNINETYKPSCVFFNFSNQNYSSDGCSTLWKPGQSNVTCSCNHLTYFGVLMTPITTTISTTDQTILSYITVIGCALSLLALVITVLLFITNRKARADVSMKVHINLAVALILLNVHFLPSQAVAAQSSPPGLCLYVALGLHYSLLATFSWMALEGFHLYILLVRVFNIYIRRYLLKLSVVGWGLPAVIVSLVVAIGRDPYGLVALDSTNSTEICYIRDNTVKMVTTVGAFGLVFVFNVIMLGVTVRRVVGLRKTKEFGQSDRDRAKRDLCTLLGVTALLGITWGLIFFSFGSLTTPGLYLFCILNSLQGFFIFLWFVMSLRKTGNNSATKTSSEMRSTNS